MIHRWAVKPPTRMDDVLWKSKGWSASGAWNVINGTSGWDALQSDSQTCGTCMSSLSNCGDDQPFGFHILRFLKSYHIQPMAPNKWYGYNVVQYNVYNGEPIKTNRLQLTAMFITNGLHQCRHAQVWVKIGPRCLGLFALAVPDGWASEKGRPGNKKPALGI